MNLPGLSDYLNDRGIENPLLCATFNQAGYLMNPSQQSCEAALRRGGFHFIAMSIMASGAVPPRAAIEYITRFSEVQAILFGASSKRNIDEIVSLCQPTGEAIPA